MYISDTLIEKLKIKIKQPDGAFEPQELLDFAHIALLSDIVPELIKSRENFYVQATPLTLASGTSEVRIPARAFGGNIRELKLITPEGQYKDLQRISEEDFDGPQSSGRPSAFCVRGNRIVLNTLADQTYSLFTTFWLTPSRIVPAAECGQVTAIVGDTATLTVPASWTTSNRFDVIKNTSDYEATHRDQTVLAVTSTTLQFASAPTDLEVGDWVALAGETPYAYLQDAYYPVLLQFAVSQMHESNGDSEQKAASDAKAEAMLRRILGVYAERVQGAPIRLKSSLI